MGRQAIVSMIVGAHYVKPWAEKFLSTWLAYCDKHDIDLIVFFERFDNSARANSRKVNWQKCLALTSDEAASYDQVLWLDGDIAINNSAAPNIFDTVPKQKIGAVGLYSVPSQSHFLALNTQPTPEGLHEAWAAGGFRAAVKRAQERLQSPSKGSPDRASDGVAEFYKGLGFPFEVRNTFNSGVFVINPAAHSEMFRTVYDKYEEFPGLRVSDNIPIPAEAYHNGYLHEIDSRFNAILYNEMIDKHPHMIFCGKEYQEHLFLVSQELFISSYFLHFAGTRIAQDLFYPVCNSWFDLLKVGGAPLPTLYFDHRTVKSSKLSLSYTEQTGHIFSAAPMTPAFGSKLIFSPTNPKREMKLSFDVEKVGGGFQKIETNPKSVRFRWIEGSGGRIPFRLDELRENYAMYRAEARFLGTGDKLLDDLLRLLFDVNGYHPTRTSYEKCTSPVGDCMTVEFFGYAAIGPDNQITLKAPAWSPFVVGGSSDARSLSVPFVDLSLELKLFAI